MTKEAFDAAVVALRDVLYSVSYSLLPSRDDQDDAVQEAIRKALQKRETLREPQYLRTWLIRILINECYAALRRKRREVPTEVIEIIQPSQADPDTFDAIMGLEVKYRLPVVLHHIEGYTTREIAHMLRVPEGTVKGRLVHARGQLRTLLEEKEASR